MRTIIQISIGVLLGVFVLLFCMANDDWVVIHLPLAPWSEKPSLPVFETRVFALMWACFFAGIVLCAFLGSLLRVRRLRRDAEKDRKMKSLEIELEKANRLIARTANTADNSSAGGGSP